MLEFTRLKRNLKKDKSGLKRIRLSLLCDSSSQLLSIALAGSGIDNGFNFEIYEANYNQIDREIFDASSSFYQSNPEITVISIGTEKILKAYYATEIENRKEFWKKYEQYIVSICHKIQSKLDCRIVLIGLYELNDGVFGNYANKLEFSFIYQIRKLNLCLMEFVQKNAGVFLCDIQSLCSAYGADLMTDRTAYIRYDLTWSLDFLPILSRNLVDIIQSTFGNSKKCLIVDLDNTLWGGVIGDDGINGIELGDLGIGKAFVELQYWIKELKQRGIIICVCSKNTPEIAKEPFQLHPDMVLKEDDIAVFVANWETKADNIAYIQSILNIGFDSMVFLDDNPFERELVRKEIPEITVPELPEDPVDYLPFLRKQNLFETSTFSKADAERTKQYKEETERTFFQKSFKNEREYLASLQMNSLVESLNAFNIPRVTQLIQRSNQFNLRTIRYTEAEMNGIATHSNYLSFAFHLADKFGDSGLVSVVIIRINSSEAFIDTWVMSCRVLKRGFENFIINTLVEAINNRGCTRLCGEYIPTKKNSIVKDLFQELGFTFSEGRWQLLLECFTSLPTSIKRK